MRNDKSNVSINGEIALEVIDIDTKLENIPAGENRSLISSEVDSSDMSAYLKLLNDMTNDTLCTHHKPDIQSSNNSLAASPFVRVPQLSPSRCHLQQALLFWKKTLAL